MYVHSTLYNYYNYDCVVIIISTCTYYTIQDLKIIYFTIPTPSLSHHTLPTHTTTTPAHTIPPHTHTPHTPPPHCPRCQRRCLAGRPLYELRPGETPDAVSWLDVHLRAGPLPTGGDQLVVLRSGCLSAASHWHHRQTRAPGEWVWQSYMYATQLGLGKEFRSTYRKSFS